MAKKTCPRCEKKYDGFPALSRRDNKTAICSDCGSEEAVMDMVRDVKRDTTVAREIRFLIKLIRAKWKK